MRIVVQVLFARFQGAVPRVLDVRAEIGDGRFDPDEVAGLAWQRTFPFVTTNGAVIHSTSWRYAIDHIVLTYIAYSDRLPIDELPDTLDLRTVPARARNGTRAGDADEFRATAAHAFRHLAFLVSEDPATYSKKLRPTTRSILARSGCSW